MFVLELVLVFAAGLVLDALNATYVRAIADRARTRAALLSGVINLLWLLVFSRVLVQLESSAAMGNVVAYALGNGCGTWVGMRRGGRV